MQEAHAQSYGLLPRLFLESILKLVDMQLTKEDYIKHKTKLAKLHTLDHVPSDIEILMQLDLDEQQFAKNMLLSKPVRTNSGVTVVAIMTKPLPCPHGKCTYCPGGPNSYFGDVPQSYTGHEPASLRGIRAAYDAYVQVFNRLEQYIVAGHNPEKVELIIMGGTFPSYDATYQNEVIHDIFQAMNDFSAQFYTPEFNLDVFKKFFDLPGSIHDTSRTTRLQDRIRQHKIQSPRYVANIKELQHENETTIIRCIGLTIETRPSHAKAEHAHIMLEQGCTRVELGVQTVYDDVLTKVHRDHSVQDTKDAIADLRDLGFKINFHVMLGLPLMTPERDIAAAHQLFDDPAFRPDMMKIYPCMVMPGTALYWDWKKGNFTPYTTEQAAKIIAEIKRFVPRTVRIMRVQRDIPTKVTTAGVGHTNLRQIVEEICAREGIQCQCIRCRECKTSTTASQHIVIDEYEANGGREFFICMNDENNRLLGFARLRFPGRSLRSEITQRSGIIRELHVYGTATRLGERGNVQHKGIGAQLMDKAEELCRSKGKDKLLVIAGVGVRQYYMRLGYENDGPYVSKKL